MELIDLAIHQSYLLLLIFARSTGLTVTAPVFSHRTVPAQLRVALALGLALVMLPVLGGTAVDRSLPALVPVLVSELAVGMLLGFVAALAFSAVQLAGALLDADLGFSMANLLDPGSGEPTALVGSLKQMLALILFLALDGHHLLLRAVLDSYTALPIAGLSLGEPAWQLVIGAVGAMFQAGFQLAMPVLAALFAATVALAVVSRSVPQLNLFVVGMPAKLAAGLILVVLALPLDVPALTHLVQETMTSLARALPLLGR